MSAHAHGGLVYLDAGLKNELTPEQTIDLIKDLARAYASLTGCMPPQLSRKELGLTRYVPTEAHVRAAREGSRAHAKERR